jgi:hypothetical protein
LVNNELERMWKEAVMGLIWGIPLTSAWRNWGKQRKTTVSIACLEQNSQTCSRSIGHSNVMFIAAQTFEWINMQNTSIMRGAPCKREDQIQEW